MLGSSRVLHYGCIEHFLGTGLFGFQRENSGVRFRIHTVSLFLLISRLTVVRICGISRPDPGLCLTPACAQPVTLTLAWWWFDVENTAYRPRQLGRSTCGEADSCCCASVSNGKLTSCRRSSGLTGKLLGQNLGSRPQCIFCAFFIELRQITSLRRRAYKQPIGSVRAPINAVSLN